MRLAEIKARPKEFIILTISIILSSILLTVPFYFNITDQIEEALVSQVPIRFEIENSSFYNLKNADTEYYRKNDDINKTFLQEYLGTLEELSERPEVIEYNCNMMFRMMGIESESEFPFTMHNYCGVNNTDFARNALLEITEGRFFTEEELQEGDSVILISSGSFTIDEEGKRKPISLGDTVKIYTFYETDSYVKTGNLYSRFVPACTEEVKVIGIYKENYRYDFSDGKDDYFINSNAPLLPEKLMEKMYFSTDFSGNNTRSAPVIINRISFQIDSYDNYDTFKQIFDEVIEHYNEYAPEALGIPVFGLKSKPQEILNTLSSLSNTKQYYSLMFILTSLISIGILFSVFLFILNNKVREMNIYYSLGKSKLKITGSYVIRYVISFLPAVIIGMAFGIILSFVISQRIVTDNVSIQNDLLRYVASGMQMYQADSSIVLTLDKAAVYKAASISSVLIIAVIAVTVAGACAVILSGNLRRKIS